jgi:GNAT superfamily N-acetyltransferase
MQFRRATLEDAYAISQLIQVLAHGFVSNSDGSGAEQFWASVSESAEASYIANPRYAYTVAMSGEVLAGFIAMRDTSHVFHLFVSHQFQRQGLATKLWAHELALAHESGHAAPFTVNSSLNAVPVYRRFGFTAVSAVTHAHGVSFLPMERI